MLKKISLKSRYFIICFLLSSGALADITLGGVCFSSSPYDLQHKFDHRVKCAQVQNILGMASTNNLVLSGYCQNADSRECGSPMYLYSKLTARASVVGNLRGPQKLKSVCVASSPYDLNKRSDDYADCLEVANALSILSNDKITLSGTCQNVSSNQCGSPMYTWSRLDITAIVHSDTIEEQQGGSQISKCVVQFDGLKFVSDDVTNPIGSVVLKCIQAKPKHDKNCVLSKYRTCI
jgi:hypothetical protein